MQLQTYGTTAPLVLEQQANSYAYLTNYANGPVIIQTGNTIALQSGNSPIVLGNYYQFNTEHKVNIDGNTFINGGATLVNGVKFTAVNPGDFVGKDYGIGIGDRYGFGQYAFGTVRAFISNAYSGGSFRVSRPLDNATNGDASFIDLVTIKYSGDMGVGTTDPAAKLDVAGRALTQQLQVKSTDWPLASTISVSDGIGTRDYLNFGITTVARGHLRLIVALRDVAGAVDSLLTVNHNFGAWYVVQVTPMLDNGSTFGQAAVSLVSQVQAKRNTRFDVWTNAMRISSGTYVPCASGTAGFLWSNVFLFIDITGVVYT